MDATASGTPTIQYHNITDQPITTIVATPIQTFERRQRHCYGDSTPGEFPLAANPSIVLHATCSFFRQPANFAPDFELSLPELAALDICQKRAIFKPMNNEERQELKQRCGGSWKLVLRFMLAGEACSRREKSQAIAGPGHSIAVTSKGAVYSLVLTAQASLDMVPLKKSGGLGQSGCFSLLRHGKELVESLQGIRIIQATAGSGRTMLISDAGRVYAFGKDSFGETEFGGQGIKVVKTPQLVESLKNIFVVQAAIGNFFTAVLSREGRVYTFSWGSDGKLGHQTEPTDVEPHPLLGALENIPVVQIAAGYCYLLALACQPSGMSVYSVGCGLGGKLGHGSRSDEKYPRLIEQFQVLNLQPMVVAAGAWHAAVVGRDGRVCTWGWGRYGCLGHGDEDCAQAPKIVESLSKIKAVHVATGDYTTFVVSEDGDVYSFGCGESASLGHNNNNAVAAAAAGAAEGEGPRHTNVLTPQIVTSLKEINERVVQISLTNSIYWNAHTFALTESGKLYAFGAGDKGQLGIELVGNQTERGNPERVDIDLSFIVKLKIMQRKKEAE
ncbi:hypothetical protein F8388_006165, partial [Cannabis sativa]